MSNDESGQKGVLQKDFALTFATPLMASVEERKAAIASFLERLAPAERALVAKLLVGGGEDYQPLLTTLGVDDTFLGTQYVRAASNLVEDNCKAQKRLENSGVDPQTTREP